jgi:hypothetical protein
MPPFAQFPGDKGILCCGCRNPSNNGWHSASLVVVGVSGQPNVSKAGKAMRPAVFFLGFRAQPPRPPFQLNWTGFDNSA